MIRVRGKLRRQFGIGALLALLAVGVGCAAGPSRSGLTVERWSSPDLGAALPVSAERWVETTLAGLTLEEKAAQMVMVWIQGYYLNPRSEEFERAVRTVRDLGVGGLIMSTSEVETLPRLINDMQRQAKIPLIIAADVERGMSFRVRRGTVALPSAMAIGATGSTEAAQFAGEITAREGRALGIHWAFAPVADVNNNPANPIINIRSFGEDPEKVATMVAAFIEGAREGGMLTTVKHFPGHGDTSTDSHLTRPVVTADRERLENVELVPFKRAIEVGVDAVMPAHVAVPALDPSGSPATLSEPISNGLLREELGFDGLVVTDALDMAGVRPAWEGEAAIKAIKAGADVLLMPHNPEVTVQTVVRGVRDGLISESRVDSSVRRLLAAKARLGLHEKRLVDRAELDENVARPEDIERAQRVAEASITMVRNEGNVLPLAADGSSRVLHLVMASGYGGATVYGPARAALLERRMETTTRVFGPEISLPTANEIVSSAGSYSHVVVSAFISGAGELSTNQVDLIRRLDLLGVPLSVISFGSPYLLTQIPEVASYLCAYGAAATSQQAAIAALLGEIDVRGRLPVTIPGLYGPGHGIELARREMSLPLVEPEKAGFRSEGLAELDRVINDFIDQKAFPGAVVAVGHKGRLAYLKGYGHLTYADDAPEVTTQTIYDLASVTKVVATTTAAMILVDEGWLDLDKPVVDFLPGFQGEGKEKVTVRDLLTHSSGLTSGGALYKEASGWEDFVFRIQGMDLEYEPGSKSVYSDYGMILMGEVVQRVAGEPLAEFVKRRVFEPLGMADTGYLPAAEKLPRIAPTEDDPWRGYVVRGEVHDENAHAMGGIAPHAGLFSTAGDLARYAQMIVNGGVFEHRRIISRRVVEGFSRRSEVPGSERAIGWDTKSPERSSAGRFFSPKSFGHLGYTGTSLWIDPDRELFLILLTNRVHPTRENILIRKARPAVADAVVQALIDPELPSAEPKVKVGLETLEEASGDVLRGKKIGLVVHRASMTEDGRHAIEVLQDMDLDVVRLFSPEHGLRGEAAAGEKVDDGVDPMSGLPLVSLYGAERKPSGEDLQDLDALVFDLQGAGVRFYTYVSTMILSLEAAAEAGIQFVVLDRPNPLGGERIEGPVSAPRDVVAESFVNLAPGPLVHGMTMGEMARFVNSRLDTPASLTVVEMEGWTRDMEWADTGRTWTPPSPNLRSAEAAIAYPGTAFLEATNVSEGRGTEAPFLVFGAPWVDSDAVDVAVRGFDLRPTAFTPRGSIAARHPKWMNEECAGIRVRVTDHSVAEPYRLGVALVQALGGQSEFEWRREGEALTWLLGTKRVLSDLQAGKSVDEIVAADRAEHESWREERREFLIY
jgi:uncharacterized protein YbbC (DUF1343 family)/beta-glucosidase-like glycosyl hydrolase